LKPTRLISPPGTYFLTSSTWQRRELFVVENLFPKRQTIIRKLTGKGTSSTRAGLG
jgi:hypothetical protein